MAHRSVVLSLVLVTCLIGAGAGTAAPSGEAGHSARLRVSTTEHGAVVRLVGARPGRVAFLLGKRVVARRRAPYRVVLAGLHPAGRARAGVVRLVVRDSRTGRRLASARFVRLRPAAALPGPAVSAPAPPAGYDLPGAAVRVSSSDGLRGALAADRPTDIVLEDGVYDAAEAFHNIYGHRLYAASPGKAVLRAGLVFGGNWGPGGGLVRGVSFDVADANKVFEDSIIHVWGTGARTQVLDVTLDGHGVVSAGVVVRRPDGFVAQRLVARNFSDYGVLVDANQVDYRLALPVLLEDLDVSAVGRPVPASSNGTAEACVWVGNTAVVRRVRTRACAWEGLWTGTASSNSLFEHIDVDGSGVGVYVEHYTTGSTFQHIHVGPGVKTGLTCEWADPAWGGKPACTDTLIQDSRFESSFAGVYLDEGTARTTIRRSTFVGQHWAGIGDYQGVANMYEGQGNDFRAIASGAVAISRDHISAATR